VRAGTELWRVEGSDPSEWTWDGFREPRYRFDPASGAFRTRYASARLIGAFRERYRVTGSVVPADHAGHRLIRLVAARSLRVLDLRTERNLDALEVDDQISTGQHDAVWDTCQHLADAARRWWPDLDAIVYRSRTTPTTSTNYAFFGTDGFIHESWQLADRVDVLVDLVLRQGFTVDWDIGGP
jgi:RES domain-containing protein